MASIWITEITFRPTGPLTFRQMPSGLLHIMSYPFMPPTTMSGFLERLLQIGEGEDWAGYGEEWYRNKGPGKEFTLTLDSRYRPLGAFPPENGWRIHKTRRHGPKNFKHRQFSQILWENHNENYELHHWDYLFCDRLTGWVAAREKAPLDRLMTLKNFGGKAGKEGYLFVETIQEPVECPLVQGDFIPLGLVTPPSRPASGHYFNLYAHHWDSQYEWLNGEKGGVAGYMQIGAWWQSRRMHGHYWQWEDGTGFPGHIPDAFLKGEAPAFFAQPEGGNP